VLAAGAAGFDRGGAIGEGAITWISGSGPLFEFPAVLSCAAAMRGVSAPAMASPQDTTNTARKRPRTTQPTRTMAAQRSPYAES
jgi:hypothetical protein